MEFTPAEIFMPGELIGKPETVLRDALGKIIYQEYDEGNEPAQVGHYICDDRLDDERLSTLVANVMPHLSWLVAFVVFLIDDFA